MRSTPASVLWCDVIIFISILCPCLHSARQPFSGRFAVRVSVLIPVPRTY